MIGIADPPTLVAGEFFLAASQRLQLAALVPPSWYYMLDDVTGDATLTVDGWLEGNL